MKVGPSFDPSDTHPDDLARAVRLEWWSVGFLLSIIAVMGVTMGASQAMRSAFLEDALSLVPPLSFLVAMRYRRKGASEKYPYGRRRAPDLAFLAASLALLAMGSILVVESSLTLVRREHPTIGSVSLFGHSVWLGWLMIGALAYSIVPPVVIGHLKQKPARRLHERALLADADMNKADWMTGVTGILGVVGIACGLWWADAVAALVIAMSIVKDGFGNTRRVLQGMMHHAPTEIGGDEKSEPLVEALRVAMRELPWVDQAEVRIREEGEVLCGEVYVVPRGALRVEDCEDAAALARALSWRFHDVVVVPVSTLSDGDE